MNSEQEKGTKQDEFRVVDVSIELYTLTFEMETARRAGFKKTLDDKEGRRRREETTRQIRKNKREENLAKRRHGMTPAPSASTEITSSGSDTDTSQRKLGAVGDIPELKRMLTDPASSDEDRVEATRGFRRILSVERDPPVDEVLAAGVLPFFVNNLAANPTNSKLVFESAWALTNIASTTQTPAVVQGGAVPPLIALLRHENADVREQATWCLGNIAGDNTEFRDYLLNEGIIAPL
jgi:importin subunit alpha-1